MSEPVVADKKPAVLTLEPGKYHWCQCGTSKKQPYCDGSHKGTGITPMMFEMTEKKQVAICMCKRTGNMPFCDGSHSKIK